MKITQTTVQNQYQSYSAKLPSLNSDEMRRLVGYLEYSRALSLLDYLVTRSTRDELALMDQIVGSRDELTVYTNISRRIPKKVASSLDEPPGSSTSFAKRGLAWMMGLARVELGAMVAGFTGQREPFAVVPPTHFDRMAYGELLLDGARTHYWSLGNDPATAVYLSYRNRQLTAADKDRGRPEIQEAQAIAYGRRAALAREFVRAIQVFGRGEFTPQQTAELNAWEEELDDLVDTIAYKVLGLGDYANATTSTSVATQKVHAGELLKGCPFLRCDDKNRPVGATITKAQPAKAQPATAPPAKTSPAKAGPGKPKSK